MSNQPNLKNIKQLEPVSVKDAGMRLDKYLSKLLPDLSRTRLKNLIQSEMVHNIKGSNFQVLTDPARMVKLGECYRVEEPEAIEATPKPENIPLNIIFEDNDVIVIEKPAGLVVHPAAGNYEGTLVNALLYHCGKSLSGIGGVIRPGIVHRIDKDTSGLMIAAKNDKAHQSLSEQFSNHTIERAYYALVKGRPNPSMGRIEGHIARHPQNRKKMAVNKDQKGKWAATNYKTLETFNMDGKVFASLVECRLETGRTHQVRVHMADIGNPLIGDPVYGRPIPKKSIKTSELKDLLEKFRRQALHAETLGFDHPISGKRLTFKSELPKDIENLLVAIKKP